ncbi:MAG: hypothetical protein AUJ96_20190 [Armatimonadetes bacterium CG2_30_66_41]|nr:methionine synthase [Armatimonadota bacterium]OIO99000.1 MAG: hypothetical protein AUJ96_20190 [Armatimonadetes bacterium CG2_30_66_41]NCO92792.1 methionine synthase [Armatimonadota bacterium]NCP28893.1 methionine synthase [Armatimonadota bacterium]NCQ30146.1 methionine synthase [Armatimonadota bacterium]
MDLTALLSGQLTVADGAWGTELQKLGLDQGACPEEWNVTHPDRVRQVARSYVEAGSEIILTNTFGGNQFALAGHVPGDRVHELNKAGAARSKEAAAGKALVAGSIGPSGKLLLMGDTTSEELAEAFAVQAAALVEGGVDALCVESMADLEEALIAVRAAKATGVPVIASLTYDSGPDKTRTMMGVDPTQAVPKLLDAGADVVGANCGLGIESYIKVCELVRAQREGPVWIKPNAGLPAVEGGRTVYRQSVEQFCSFVPQLLEAGATVLGGCCGTTPEHVRRLAQALTLRRA